MQSGEPHPKVVIFDLDGTLAASFTPPAESMIELLERLSRHVPLSVMSAATFERIQNDVLAPLSHISEGIGTHAPFVFSLNGAQCWIKEDGQWNQHYDFAFSEADTALIRAALATIATETRHLDSILPKGSQIIDYKGYLAFTALGADASMEEKAAWDPDGAKRKEIKAMIEQLLPQYDVFIGGRTTIDIIPKGKNKRFSVEWLATHLSITPAEMLFIGDGLGEGGNDSVVIPTGIQTRAVANPADTAKIIEELLTTYSAKTA
jgi:phosphomannomutase